MQHLTSRMSKKIKSIIEKTGTFIFDEMSDTVLVLCKLLELDTFIYNDTLTENKYK